MQEYEEEYRVCSVKLLQEEYEAVKQLAEARQSAVSSEIRAAVQEFLQTSRMKRSITVRFKNGDTMTLSYSGNNILTMDERDFQLLAWVREQLHKLPEGATLIN